MTYRSVKDVLKPVPKGTGIGKCEVPATSRWEKHCNLAFNGQKPGLAAT